MGLEFLSMFQIMSRFSRRLARRSLRSLWHILRFLHLAPRADYFLKSPVDLKVGKQLEANRTKRVIAICDLATFPISFDIVYFFVIAENIRRRQGASFVDIVIISHDDDPLSVPPANSDPINSKNYRIFLNNIGIACAQLLPNLGNVLNFNNRGEFEKYWKVVRNQHQIYPDNYSPYCPDYADKNGHPVYGLRSLIDSDGTFAENYCLTPTTHHLEQVRKWVNSQIPKEHKVITITLRETPHVPERNSNLSAWQKLVSQYQNSPITFVVIRDYFSLYEPSPIVGENIKFCTEAVLHAPIRAALYQEADINLMVANGTVGLCMLNHQANYIVFKYLCEGAPSASENDIWNNHGLKPGDQIPGANKWQRIIWEPDDFDILNRELDSFLREHGTESLCIS